MAWSGGEGPGDPVSGSEQVEDAAHIASWNPTVALAVAAMLDAVAATFHPDQLVLGEDFWSDVQHAALAVARTYLNGAAQ